jgi:hypothetical protein
MNGRTRGSILPLNAARVGYGLLAPPGRAWARRSECGPPTAAAADPFHGVG